VFPGSSAGLVLRVVYKFDLNLSMNKIYNFLRDVQYLFICIAQLSV
jgi:hypothetical protein